MGGNKFHALIGREKNYDLIFWNLSLDELDRKILVPYKMKTTIKDINLEIKRNEISWLKICRTNGEIDLNKIKPSIMDVFFYIYSPESIKKFIKTVPSMFTSKFWDETDDDINDNIKLKLGKLMEGKLFNSLPDVTPLFINFLDADVEFKGDYDLDLNEKIRSITNLIANNKTKEALDQLIIFYQEMGNETKLKNAIQILSRLNDLNQRTSIGIISSSDELIEKNKITNSIITLLTM